MLMMSRTASLLLATAVLTAGICLAQFQPRSRTGSLGAESGKLVRIEGGGEIDEDAVRTARETRLYRLQQLTSIRTDPDCRVLKLTDLALFDYPLLYLEHAGYMRLSDDEVAALRK